jgi:hypothetical protein
VVRSFERSIRAVINGVSFTKTLGGRDSDG